MEFSLSATPRKGSIEVTTLEGRRDNTRQRSSNLQNVKRGK